MIKELKKIENSSLSSSRLAQNRRIRIYRKNALKLVWEGEKTPKGCSKCAIVIWLALKKDMRSVSEYQL